MDGELKRRGNGKGSKGMWRVEEQDRKREFKKVFKTYFLQSLKYEKKKEQRL